MKFAVQRTFALSPQYAALLSLTVGCLVASLTPIFMKWGEQEIGAYSTVFYCFFFSFLILSLSNSISSINLKVAQKVSANNKEIESDTTDYRTPKTIWLLLLAGIFTTGTQICWAISLTQTSVGNSALLHSLAPLFTLLFTWLFLREKVESRLLIGMFIAIGGSVLLASGDFQVSVDKFQGDGFALLSAAFFAGYLTVVKQLRVYLSSRTILFWRFLVGAILVLPFLLFSSDPVVPFSTFGWLVILGLACTATISHWLIASSLATLSSTFVAVALLLDPFLSSMQAWMFFSEKISILEWISFAIVTLGVYLAITSEKEIEDGV